GGSPAGGRRSHAPEGCPGTAARHTVVAMRSDEDSPAEPDTGGPGHARPRTREAVTRDRRARLVGTLRAHAGDLSLVALALIFFAVAWPIYFVTHEAWTVLVPIIAAS